jgi:hypothetical protein
MDDFDLDYDEVLESKESLLVTVRNDDRRICACGHGMSRHKYDKFQNRHFCKPGAYACPCINQRAVLEVPNTRFFMRKSHGSGKKHALAMGYAASKETYGDEEFTQKVEWLIPKQCEICKVEAPYYPVRVTSTGVALLDSEDDQGVTAFLCADCRDPREHSA